MHLCSLLCLWHGAACRRQSQSPALFRVWVCKPQEFKHEREKECKFRVAGSIMHLSVCRSPRKSTVIGSVDIQVMCPTKSSLHIQEGTPRLPLRFKEEKYETVSLKCSCGMLEAMVCYSTYPALGPSQYSLQMALVALLKQGGSSKVFLLKWEAIVYEKML